MFGKLRRGLAWRAVALAGLVLGLGLSVGVLAPAVPAAATTLAAIRLCVG